MVVINLISIKFKRSSIDGFFLFYSILHFYDVSACGTWFFLQVFLCVKRKRLRHLLFSALEDGITSKNQRFLPVIPEGGTGIVYNARIACGIFYAFVAFPKRSFGAQKGIKNAPYREHCKRCREDGIRTHDAVAHIQTFQACSFNHSDTSLGNCGCK